mgnify:CR=1 FL=1
METPSLVNLKNAIRVVGTRVFAQGALQGVELPGDLGAKLGIGSRLCPRRVPIAPAGIEDHDEKVLEGGGYGALPFGGSISIDPARDTLLVSGGKAKGSGAWSTRLRNAVSFFMT